MSNEHGIPREWGAFLAATDGSDGALRAVDAAATLAAALTADLWILNVVDDKAEPFLSGFAHAEEASIGDAVDAMAHRILLEAATRSKERGATRVHTLLRSGDSADEIVAAARTLGVSCIFVGRRGAGGRLAQALMGSVSQKLAGLSPIMLGIVP